MAKKERASLEEIQQYFGDNTEVTTSQIRAFEEFAGKWAPQIVWDSKLSRRVYSLRPGVTPAVVVQQHSEIETIHPTPETPTVPVPKTPIAAAVEAPAPIAREIDVFNREAFIPIKKDSYVPWGNFSTVEKLVKSNHFFTLYIAGESGTGKNAMISQVCAKLRRPLIRVNITRDTKEEHLVGSKTLIDGNIVYEDGPVIWCAENGAVLCLDEISAGDPNELLCIQSVMEGGEFYVKSLNRMVKPKPGFAIIASDNTKGQGSDSGKYIGTYVQNSAFLDRFDMMLSQGYPPLNIELQILTHEWKQYAELTPDAEKFISDVANWVGIIRRTYDQDAIDDLITTRRALKIIKSRALWFSEKDAIAHCITRFDDTIADAFKALWEKMKSGQISNQAAATV